SGSFGPAGRRAAVVALSALILLGCGKKKEEEAPIPPPPPQGAASSDELSTGLGQARGLDEQLAPTSARWLRAFMLDDKRAVITGEVVNETIALITDDGGKTWKSMR